MKYFQQNFLKSYDSLLLSSHKMIWENISQLSWKPSTILLLSSHFFEKDSMKYWFNGLILWIDPINCPYWLILGIDLMNWTHGLILWIGLMDWFYGLILWIDLMDWFYGLILWIDLMDWSYGLILWTDLKDWS